MIKARAQRFPVPGRVPCQVYLLQAEDMVHLTANGLL